MDKHKALIEKVADVQIEVANGLARRMLAGETFKTRHVQLECAKAALSAVYEALKEPSEEMLQAGHETLYEEPYDATRDFALAPTWQAMLSASALSSPLGKGEREPVNNGERQP